MLATSQPTSCVSVRVIDLLASRSRSRVTRTNTRGFKKSLSGLQTLVQQITFLVVVSPCRQTVMPFCGAPVVMESRSQYTNPFAAVPSLPSDAQIASDTRNNSIFYGASGSKFYISRDGGRTFTSPSTLGPSTAADRVVVHPSVSGDVWISSDKGIFHSTNFGTSFTQVNGAASANSGGSWQCMLRLPSTLRQVTSVRMMQV